MHLIHEYVPSSIMTNATLQMQLAKKINMKYFNIMYVQ